MAAPATRPIPIGGRGGAGVAAPAGSADEERRRALLLAASRAPVIGSLPAPDDLRLAVPKAYVVLVAETRGRPSCRRWR